MPRFRIPWRTFTIDLKGKIILYALLPVVAVLGLVIGLSLLRMYGSLRTSIEHDIVLAASDAALEIEKGNLQAVTTVKVMALAQEAGMFGQREQSAEFARRVLLEFPQYTGSYFGYEPNADQDDQKYRAGPEVDPRFLDAGGRFLPYWYWDLEDSSRMRVKELIDMEVSLYYNGVRDKFLALPRDKRSDPTAEKYMVTEPYLYENKMIVEQTFPISINGKFVGIAGVDRALADIQRFLSDLKLRDNMDFILISRQGKIISSTLDEAIEQRIEHTVGSAEKAKLGEHLLRTRSYSQTDYAKILKPFYERFSEHRDDRRTRQSSLGRGTSNRSTMLQAFEDPRDGQDYYFAGSEIDTGDWTLVVRVPVESVNGPIRQVFIIVLALSAIGLLVTTLLLLRLARGVTERLGMAVAAADRVAAGDLTQQIQVDETDEAGRLLTSINAMTTKLQSLLGKVKEASVGLTTTATQIAAAARQEETSVSDFSTSAQQISSAVHEISATSRELSETMHHVSSVAAQTAELADEGRSSLANMEGTMRKLAEATGSISGKLSVINEKAGDINAVVTAITKVADQTNLLSVNAAIEAEKAGEAGQGFQVVAREIRRLADQTGVASLDIEQMVKQMQSAVSSGVMEMDKFSDEVRKSVSEAAEISSQFSRIIQSVQALTIRFEQVSEGMQSQTVGASQISEAMGQLNETARLTADSLADFKNATHQLRDAVQGLQVEISRFKVADGQGGE